MEFIAGFLEQWVGEGNGGIATVVIGIVIMLLQIPKSERAAWGVWWKNVTTAIPQCWKQARAELEDAREDGAIGQEEAVAVFKGFWRFGEVFGVAGIRFVYLVLPFTYGLTNLWRGYRAKQKKE